MAFRTKKISQMDPKGANLAPTDLLEISELVSGSYVTKSITGAQIAASAPAAAWGTITGTLSAQTDLNTALSGKVPTSRTLTINGTTQDLSADRTFTISTGITIGTTAITSGTNGRFLFDDAGVVSETNGAFWDKVNGRWGIGTSTPAQKIDVLGNVNGGNLINIKNASSGTSAVSGFQCENNTTNGSLFLTSSTYTPNGVLGANTLGFFSNSTSPIAICSGNIIVMSTGGVTERLRIGTTGNVLINTTTDAGFKLDVNGTARVKGTGTTGATFALTVQNSASTNIMRLQDDGYLNVTAGVFTSAIRGVNVEFTNLLYGANFWCTVDGSIKIGSGQSASVASAIFQADSTTRGFLPPRMTTTQKNAIASPATGLMVYDTTLNLMALYNGTTWTTL
jgi:hypothetical protein